MVLALALDAAVGIFLFVDGVRLEDAGSRYVGAVLLLCAVMLGAVPWLNEVPAIALPLGDDSRV
jgi:hypothetical protein